MSSRLAVRDSCQDAPPIGRVIAAIYWVAVSECGESPRLAYLTETCFMLDDVTIESFRPHVGETFLVEAPDGQRVTLTLSEVSTTATDDDRRRTRAPFSLIFRPASGQILRQGMYRMEGGPGTIDIFLVPIMPDREGPRIQAVFG